MDKYSQTLQRQKADLTMQVKHLQMQHDIVKSQLSWFLKLDPKQSKLYFLKQSLNKAFKNLEAQQLNSQLLSESIASQVETILSYKDCFQDTDYDFDQLFDTLNVLLKIE